MLAGGKGANRSDELRHAVTQKIRKGSRTCHNGCAEPHRRRLLLPSIYRSNLFVWTCSSNAGLSSVSVALHHELLSFSRVALARRPRRHVFAVWGVVAGGNTICPDLCNTNGWPHSSRVEWSSISPEKLELGVDVHC